VGIAATEFCHPGGILQLFHRQDQQILRLPTAAAAARSHPANYRLCCWEASSANSSGTGSATRKKVIIIILKIASC
jgi:hypothetical protein